MQMGLQDERQLRDVVFGSSALLSSHSLHQFVHLAKSLNEVSDFCKVALEINHGNNIDRPQGTFLFIQIFFVSGPY